MVRSGTREVSGAWKRVRTKHALYSNWKRGIIGGMNNAMVIRKMQSRKMSRVRSHMKGSVRI
jgi:hypothetical protein